MSRREINEEDKLWRTIVWTLRITVALLCLGNWRWLSQIEETPLMSLFWDQPDVGGLGWSEATSLTIEHSIGWLALLGGVCVLARPCAAVLGPLVLLQLLIALAMWRTGDGYALQANWLPLPLVALFPFATQSARIVAPLGLLLLDPWLVERPLSQRRVAAGIGCMRWGVATAFAAHGIEAWLHNPAFIDLLINSSQRLLGWNLTQTTAEQLLSIIGILDLLVAIGCVGSRSRVILWWMAIWGAITACSRITANGLDTSWHATVIRWPHVGLPLAVVLYWYLLQRSHGCENAQDSVPSPREPSNLNSLVPQPPLGS